MRDYSTGTEHDAAISASHDAYPRTADLLDYDPLAEAEWEAARKAAEANPHDWPREAEGRLMRALRAAEAEVKARRAEQ